MPAVEARSAHTDLGVVEGAVFSLLGLLIAFRFAGAATRFDGRRQLIVEEARPPRRTGSAADAEFIGRGVKHESKNTGQKPADVYILAIK